MAVDTGAGVVDWTQSFIYAFFLLEGCLIGGKGVAQGLKEAIA